MCIIPRAVTSNMGLITRQLQVPFHVPFLVKVQCGPIDPGFFPGLTPDPGLVQCDYAIRLHSPLARFSVLVFPPR